MIKFGGIDFKTYDYRLIDVEESFLPQMRGMTEILPSGEGAAELRRYMQPKMFRVTGRVFADNRYQLNAKLTRLAGELANNTNYFKNAVALHLPDREHYYMAVIDGMTPFKRARKTGVITIDFVANDPFGYRETKHEKATNETGMTIVNEGNYPTYPSFELKLPISISNSFVFLQEMTSVRMPAIEFEYTSDSSATVGIATARERVYIIGGTNTEIWVHEASDFFSIPIGEVELEFGIDVHGSILPITVEVAYKERFLGL